MCKNNIVNVVNPWVWLGGINEFSVKRALFLCKKFSDGAAGSQAHSQFLGVSDHGGGGRHESPMLPSRVVNEEGRFLANCNKTAQDVGSGNGARVPGMYKKKDSLKLGVATTKKITR